MKKILMFSAMVFMAFASCVAGASDSADGSLGTAAKNYLVKITAGSHEVTATFEDNATSRALIEKMPFTISMENLYGREMCYRYGGGTFKTSSLRYDGYEVGDIAYWPPRGSLVILYDQNGEEFERQHIGHISGDVGFFFKTRNNECEI